MAPGQQCGLVAAQKQHMSMCMLALKQQLHKPIGIYIGSACVLEDIDHTAVKSEFYIIDPFGSDH
jgi:hypothetical protein